MATYVKYHIKAFEQFEKKFEELGQYNSTDCSRIKQRLKNSNNVSFK